MFFLNGRSALRDIALGGCRSIPTLADSLLFQHRPSFESGCALGASFPARMLGVHLLCKKLKPEQPKTGTPRLKSQGLCPCGHTQQKTKPKDQDGKGDNLQYSRFTRRSKPVFLKNTGRLLALAPPRNPGAPLPDPTRLGISTKRWPIPVRSSNQRSSTPPADSLLCTRAALRLHVRMNTPQDLFVPKLKFMKEEFSHLFWVPFSPWLTMFSLGIAVITMGAIIALAFGRVTVRTVILLIPIVLVAGFSAIHGMSVLAGGRAARLAEVLDLPAAQIRIQPVTIQTHHFVSICSLNSTNQGQAIPAKSVMPSTDEVAPVATIYKKFRPERTTFDGVGS